MIDQSLGVLQLAEPPYFIIGGFLALFLLVIIISTVLEKKRTKALVSVAKSLEMVFDPDGAWVNDSVFLGSGLDLMKKGHSRRMKHVMRRQLADVTAYIFDYRYTTGSGKNSTTHLQTVAGFEINNVTLPQFRCKPERFYHKVADALGKHDIDFERFPEFSKRYRLNADNELEMHEVFSDELIRLLEQEADKEWSIEGKRNLLIVYRQRRRIKPAEWTAFFLDATKLMNAFTLKRAD